MTPYENLIPPRVGRGIYGQVFDSPDATVGGVLVGQADMALPDGIKVNGAIPTLPVTDDDWAGINEAMRTYFPEDQIVGWYRGRPGVGATMGDVDRRAHEAWFASPEQVMLCIDPRAGEEAVYGWHAGRLRQLRQGPTPRPGLGGGTPRHLTLDEDIEHDEDKAKGPKTRDDRRLRDRGAGAIVLALALPIALGLLLGIGVWLAIAPSVGVVALP